MKYLYKLNNMLFNQKGKSPTDSFEAKAEYARIYGHLYGIIFLVLFTGMGLNLSAENEENCTNWEPDDSIVESSPAKTNSFLDCLEDGLEDGPENCPPEKTALANFASLTATVGDRIWHDINANGIQDLEEEDGIDGAEILLINVESNDTISGFSSFGTYHFPAVDSGLYVMQIFPAGSDTIYFSPQYQGTDDKADSNFDPITGFSDTILVGAESADLSIDAGFFALASISGFAWWDMNSDGIVDSTEANLENIEFELVDQSGDTSILVTDSLGLFSLTGLIPGIYKIIPVIPPSLVVSSDSLSYSFDLGSGEDVDNLDFGFNTMDVVEPVDSCLAEVGNITAPETLIYASGALTDAPTLDGNNTDSTYTTVFLLTTDLDETDETLYNLIQASFNGEFDLNVIDTSLAGPFDVHVLNLEGTALDFVQMDLSSGEDVLAALADGFCADFEVAVYQISILEDVVEPVDSCLANVGTLTAPETLIYMMGDTSAAPIVEGQNTDSTFLQFYVLTADLDPEDDVLYNIVQLSDNGQFDLGQLDTSFAGPFYVHAFNLEGTVADIQALELTTGEELLDAIADGLCADFIIEAYQISYFEDVVEPGDSCLATAGIVSPPEVLVYMEGDTTNVPLMDEFTNSFDFVHFLILTTDLDTADEISYNFVQFSSTGQFNLGSLDPALEGPFDVHVVNFEGTTEDIVAWDYNSIEALTTAIEDGLCADVITAAYSISYGVVEPVDSCLANAGNIAIPETLIYLEGDTTNAPVVDGQNTDSTFTQLYVLTTDLDSEDDISYDIVQLSSTGAFDLGQVDTALAGPFDVHVVNFEGTTEDLLALDITTGEELATAIEDGLCADFVIAAFQVSYFEDVVEPNDSCLANAGTISIPETLIYMSGDTTDAPLVDGQNTDSTFTQLYVLTTDLDSEDDISYDIVQLSSTGEFDLGQVDTALAGPFDVHVVNFEGTAEDILALDITTGEELAIAIEDGLCADFVIAAFQVSYFEDVVEPNDSCLADAGILFSPSMIIIPSGGIVEAPNLIGDNDSEEYATIFLLVTDSTMADTTTQMVLSFNDLGSFDFGDLELPDADYQIFALNFEIDQAEFGDAGFATITMIENNQANGWCADLSNPITLFVGLENDTCDASAGTLSYDGPTNLNANGVIENVISEDAEDDLPFYYVLVVDAIEDDGITTNIIAIDTLGEFDLSQLGIPMEDVSVYGISIDMELDLVPEMFENLEALQEAINQGYCAEITADPINFNVNLCFAQAGNFVEPETLNYEGFEITDTLEVENNATNAGFNYYYFLTTDVNGDDEIAYNIILTSTSGSFDLNMIGVPNVIFNVIGVSTDLSLDELMANGIATGEDLLALEGNADICVDVVIGSFDFIIGEPDGLCFADAGTLVAPDDLVIDGSVVTPVIDVFDQDSIEDLSYYFVLAFDGETALNIIQVEDSSSFDLTLFGVSSGDFSVIGISTALTAEEVLAYGTIEELEAAIADESVCADLSSNTIVYDYTGNAVCFAEAGTLITPSVTFYPEPQVTVAIEVAGENQVGDFNFYYILTADAEEGDAIVYDLILVSDTGSFNLPLLGLEDGTYNVFGISTTLSIEELMDLDLGSIEGINAAIEDGLCAHVTDQSVTLFIGEEITCFANAGILTIPNDTEYNADETTLAPVVNGQSTEPGFNYSFVLTTDADTTDLSTDNIVIVSQTGAFNLEELNLLPGAYSIYGISILGNVDDLSGLGVTTISDIQDLIDDGLVCADINPLTYDFVIAEVCVNNYDICTPSIFESTTPTLVCPTFCNLEDDDFTLQYVTSIFNCSVEIQPDSVCFTFLPLPGLENDILEAVACNSEGICDTVFYNVIIGCQDPIAMNDQFFAAWNTTSSLDVLLNDEEICDQFIYVDSIGSLITGEGSIVINADSSAVDFTPADGFTGTATFNYIVCNECGNCVSANVVVDVLEAEDLVANNDTVLTPINSTVTIDVLANDTGTQIEITAVTQPENGTVEVIDGMLVYTPDEGFEGTETIIYTICDIFGECTTATVVIQVGTQNEAPIAGNDQYVIAEGDSVTLDVLINDFDPNGDTLYITEIIGPDAGTVIINDDGTLTYIADTTAGPGEYTFQYVICDDTTATALCDTATVVIAVGIDLSNTPPMAVDDFANVNPGDTVTINVLLNDTDLEGNNLTVTEISDPPFGDATLNDDGTITYIPVPGFTGVDSLFYVICDDGNPPLCDTAWVYIDVSNNGLVIANPDVVTTPINTEVEIDVMVNDVGEGIFISNATEPENGALVIIGDLIYYTPFDGFVGTDFFTYTICDPDGNCDITVVGITIFDGPNQAPTAANDVAMTDLDTPITINVTANDSDPENGNLVITEIINGPDNGTVVINDDGTLTYTPDTGFEGEDEFQYVVCDEADPPLCDTATVVISVNVPLSNDPPLAVDDAYTVAENDFIIFNVTDNDSVGDGETMTVKLGTAPANGTLQLDENGLALYTPDENFEGTDYFLYILCDNGNPALQDTALVTITVEGDGINPTSSLDAQVDIVQTPINTSIPIFVLDNDTWDGNITIKSFSDPINGLVVLDELTNSLVYVPALNYTGEDYFMYWITDDSGACDSATVAILVFNEPNLPPNADNDQETTSPGETVVINVLANDSDPENLPLVVTNVINGPSNGSVIINADGTISYTPDDGFIGEDSFDYIVCDTAIPPLCDTATVVIAVGVDLSNDPPLAVDDYYVGAQDSTISILLLNNDSDPNGDNFSLTFNTNPLFGEVIVNEFGLGNYTPNPGYMGEDQFVYVICDDGFPSLCDTATVFITIDTITISNLPPIVANPDVGQVYINDTISLDILVNDIGTNITITDIEDPENGSIIVIDGGVITYVPDLDFTGIDYFWYTICDEFAQCDSTLVAIEVFDGDNRPPATTNDCFETDTDTPITINVLANDVDPENSALIFQGHDAPGAGGLISVLSFDGSLEYTPPAGFVGVEVFNYNVCDGFFEPGGTALCDSGQVVIKVGGVDAPNHPPVANDSCVIVNNTSVVIDLQLLTSDPDGDNLIYQLATPSVFGDVAIDPLSGTAAYAPFDGFDGTDYFTYIVCDDGLPSLCDTSYIKLIVTDTIDIVNPTDTIVVAVNDSVDVLTGACVQVQVLLNDSFPTTDVTELEISIIAQPINGTLTDNGLGLMEYCPDEGFMNDSDFAVYELCFEGICDTAIIFFNVLGCDLVIPDALSPNMDGMNDYFAIPGLNECYGDNFPEMIIYNRWGNVVFRMVGYTGFDGPASWNGEWQSGNGSSGRDVPDGTYYYILLLDPQNDPDAMRAGFIEVLR